jgi:dihydroorotase
LPARRQAREAPAGAAQGGDKRHPQVLPRHRQRAASAKDKESACGCAGIFNAPFALESYLAVFDEEGALDKFEGFASLHGPAFYKLPVNDEKITLTRAEVAVPPMLHVTGEEIVPWHAGQMLGWKLAG